MLSVFVTYWVVAWCGGDLGLECRYLHENWIYSKETNKRRGWAGIHQNLNYEINTGEKTKPDCDYDYEHEQ